MSQLALIAAGDRANAAWFSPDEVYRYALTRELGGDRTLVSMGLNPSTATAEIDDPTVRKDQEFARRWRCGRVVKLNAYAYRATDPQDMKRAAKRGVDIVGNPENDDYIRAHLAMVLATQGRLVVSWGNHIDPARQCALADLIEGMGVTPWCLGMNKNGSPVHELYIPYSRELTKWRCP